MLFAVASSIAAVLAQADGGAGGAVNPAADPAPGAWWIQMIPFLAIPVLAYYMLIVPERQRKARLDKLHAVKEKDHVVTSSGIHGVITQVNRDQGRATLRIDESNGTKIRIELAAIARVVTENDKAAEVTKDSK